MQYLSDRSDSADLSAAESRPQFVELVSPDGLIKHVRIGNTITSPLVDVEFDKPKREEAAIFAAAVRVTAAAERAHWVLLSTLYQAENNPDGLKARAEYLAYAARCEARGQKVAAFPESRLPREVIARRNGAARHQQVAPPSFMSEVAAAAETPKESK